MEIHIQQATPQDAALIAPLFDAYRVFYGQPTDLSLAHTFISDRLTAGESTIFMATTSGHQVAGFVQLYPTFSSVSAKPAWILNDLFVSSQHRGHGIAKRLMLQAQQFAKDTSANNISLETAPDNQPARALYESLGYELETHYLSYSLKL